jgi:hypothetical protein
MSTSSVMRPLPQPARGPGPRRCRGRPVRRMRNHPLRAGRGGPDCLECRSLAQLSVEELGEPLRTATVRRLDEMLAGLRSHALGVEGVELADLILCLRVAVGEAADPLLGTLADGRPPEPPMAQRAGDIGRRAVAVLETLLGESPAARCRPRAELSPDELCARAGTGFVRLTGRWPGRRRRHAGSPRRRRAARPRARRRRRAAHLPGASRTAL